MGAWIEMSIVNDIMMDYYPSHPLWVRGLKFLWCQKFPNICFVAPFMGAWIEMMATWYFYEKPVSRTLYGCVDWNIHNVEKLREKPLVASFMGAWIEIKV